MARGRNEHGQPPWALSLEARRHHALETIATSGGSGIGGSAANLQMLAAGAKIATGKRFDANTSADKLADWAKQWL